MKPIFHLEVNRMPTELSKGIDPFVYGHCGTLDRRSKVSTPTSCAVAAAPGGRRPLAMAVPVARDGGLRCHLDCVSRSMTLREVYLKTSPAKKPRPSSEKIIAPPLSLLLIKKWKKIRKINLHRTVPGKNIKQRCTKQKWAKGNGRLQPRLLYSGINETND